ncbi:MAG TPA: IS110 family transposase [Alphaproteobacteria bacterium]|nr:IS110 family transposase [Alphaproteobacteria bacterium]
MSEIATVGLDLAKRVFQVHAVSDTGAVVARKRLTRSQVLEFFAKLSPCLVGMEACATAHHWARELMALGHEVKLMPPQYVKAYVKRNKNDEADAEAICEAVRRPSMRFVAIKTPEQQAALSVHRNRDLLVRQRNMLVNALRAHLAEFGIVEAQGMPKVTRLMAIVRDEADGRVPGLARQALRVIADQLDQLKIQIAALTAQIAEWHQNNQVSQRLASIPGIGPITATAISATVPDAAAFRSGREFAAWLGLVPRQNGTGGKVRLGGISKRGDRYIRRLLVGGAMTILMRKAERATLWVRSLATRKRHKVVAVALANKMARMAWAIMYRKTVYRPVAVPA